MIYKFKSKATGDLIMLQPQGDQVLRLLGREPAASGIIEVAAMAAARQRLQQALDDAERTASGTASPSGDGDEPDTAQAVGLRQRLWPMVQMLERAEAGGEAIVWGV